MQKSNLSVAHPRPIIYCKCSDFTVSPREMEKSHKLPISNFQGPFEDCNFKKGLLFYWLDSQTGHYVIGSNHVHTPMCKPQ